MDFEIRYAKKEEYGSLLETIDSVFGFPSERTKGFLWLLPKLYRPEYDPCAHNLVAVRDGEIIGAVGIYQRKIHVGDTVLTSAGIGNVSCRPEYRKSGVMTSLMTYAKDEIIKSGAELSDLGGRRHRYGHYGFEPAGRYYSFGIDRSDFSHIGGGDGGIEAAKMTDEYIKDAEALYKRGDFYIERVDFALFSRSWEHEVKALVKNGEFRGYAVTNGDTVYEIKLLCADDLVSAVYALMQNGDNWLELRLHEGDRELCRRAYEIFSECRIRMNEMVSVWNFRAVAEAYLRYAASLKKLGDGELPLVIDGVAGREEFTLVIKGGEVSVRDGAAVGTRVMSHREASGLLFGALSYSDAELTAESRAWLPLPIYFPEPDCV